MKRIPEWFVLLMMLIPLTSEARSKKTITIAVIDTGIDKSLPHLCKFGHKSFVDRLPDPLSDEHGHGTHIAGLIDSNAGDGNYCLVSIKYFDSRATGAQNLASLIKAMQYAVNIKVSFINLSGGGPTYYESERKVVESALSRKIKMVAAAGNEKSDLDEVCNYYPACYDDRIISVGNLEIAKGYMGFSSDTERAPSSNYGSRVTRWEIGTDVLSTLPGGQTGRMSGTSQATAVATGKLVREILQK